MRYKSLEYFCFSLAGDNHEVNYRAKYQKDRGNYLVAWTKSNNKTSTTTITVDNFEHYKNRGHLKTWNETYIYEGDGKMANTLGNVRIGFNGGNVKEAVKHSMPIYVENVSDTSKVVGLTVKDAKFLQNEITKYIYAFEQEQKLGHEKRVGEWKKTTTLYDLAVVDINGQHKQGRVENITPRGILVKFPLRSEFVKWINVRDISKGAK